MSPRYSSGEEGCGLQVFSYHILHCSWQFVLIDPQLCKTINWVTRSVSLPTAASLWYELRFKYSRHTPGIQIWETEKDILNQSCSGRAWNFILHSNYKVIKTSQHFNRYCCWFESWGLFLSAQLKPTSRNYDAVILTVLRIIWNHNNLPS